MRLVVLDSAARFVKIVNNVLEFRVKMMMIARLDSAVATTRNVGLGYA